MEKNKQKTTVKHIRCRLIGGCVNYEQESCAIAKMTAQCALHMGALKIFATP